MTQISSFLGLQTSLRGLLAQQRALDVTSHNIANAGTTGYTRQRVELSSAPTLAVESGAIADGAGAYLGQGVEVEAYARVRDAFLDLQWRAQSMSASERDASAEGLGRVEESLSEPGPDGISALLQKFWNAWSDVSNHPADPPTKQALVEAANTLTTAVRDLDARLSAVSTAAADEYSALTTSPQSPIFTLAQELAQLNPAIKLAQAAGRAPNDLLDRRDLLLDQLAQYGQVSVSDSDADGAIDVAFGVPATALVSGTTGAATPPLPATTGSGRLGALLGLQQKVADYRTEINGFVSGLVTAVNTAHGTPFFAAGGTTAATIAVTATAATVRTTASGGAGANEIATAIAGLRNGTVDRAYDAFVRHIGADAAAANQAKTTADALMVSVDERRSGVSGVSLDEEMTNMIAFQRGYQAASRAMSTIDEMLDTLINRTGRVGL